MRTAGMSGGVMRSKAISILVGLLLGASLTGLPVVARAKPDRPSKRHPAVALAIKHLGVKPKSVTVTDLYTSDHNRVTHVYLRQVIRGEETLGAEATVNVQNGAVVYGVKHFIKPGEATGDQVLDASAALDAAISSLRTGSYEVTRPPALAYRVLDDHTARLAYDMEIATDDGWWNLSVDAETGEIVHRYSLIDSEKQEHISARTARPEDAAAVEALLAVKPVLPPQRADDGSSYNVYAMPMESPNDGDRSIVENPADAVASPFGWHDTNGIVGPEFTITRGNNVNAYADTADDESADPASQPDGGRGLDFNHQIPTFDATPAVYRDAAVDNLFYWNNVMHDVTFRYGFTEEAGNFQASNYTGVGRAGDEVQAEAQDGSGALNANFATPVEGVPGRMQMYLWVDAFDSLSLQQEDVVRQYSHQVRDGDLDGGVIAHEYGHGISNRLVGGPNNVSCLRTHDEREGEGWSDFWSYVLTMRKGDDGRTPRGIGTYVVYHEEGRSGTGIRTVPYSTNMKVNPHTYESIRTAIEPHGVGEVWATMLWDLYWNLVDEHGFNPNPYESWRTGGNNLAIQLVVDGMKFAPCEPGFVEARDAIIAADQALTGNAAKGVPGRNECLIWRSFARRGLGVNAKQGDFENKADGKNGFKVPAHCR
ncbi:MAG TPA: M36 family metallopeptidase [Actinomycetota bacterium]|nr:M36 family metallopeptidase [Actinomycetota bacterium]